jgi:hypothetical protein
MALLRVVVVAALILAGCGAGAGSAVTSEAAPSSDSEALLESPRATETPSPTPSTAPALATERPTPRPAPRATPRPTPAPPAKPTEALFERIEMIEPSVGDDDESDAEQYYVTTYEVSWRTPRTDGVEIRVWGITKCLAEPAHPKPGTSGPCLVKGTRLSKSVETLIATAPASAGKVTWTWRSQEGCNLYDSLWNADAPEGQGEIFAIVVGAYSGSGQSVFAIAHPGLWSVPDAGDTFC